MNVELCEKSSWAIKMEKCFSVKSEKKWKNLFLMEKLTKIKENLFLSLGLFETKKTEPPFTN